MEDWNIQTRSSLCSICQKGLAEKDVFHTVLSLVNGVFQRQEFCHSCWESSSASILQKMQVISCWQGVCELPPAQPVDPLPKEDAESILRRMIERNDPVEMEARYILAVMLERKRIFKHRETQKTGERILVYEHLKTGEVFLITDPQLQLNRMQDVQKKVALMLQSPSPTVEQPASAISSGAETGVPLV